VKVMQTRTWLWYLNEWQSGHLARFWPYGCTGWMKLACVPTYRASPRQCAPPRRKDDTRAMNPAPMHCSRTLNTEQLAQSLGQFAHASKCPLVKLGPFADASDARQRSRRLFCLITRMSATQVTGMGVAQTLSYSQCETSILSCSI